MFYLKSEIENSLDNNPNKLLKEISAGLEPYLQYYSVLRFNDLLKFIKSSFNEYNFFRIFGASGSGKSSFKTLLKNTFNKDTDVFEYSCSEITELDDIFFKFYKFMGNHPLKSDFLRITKNQQKAMSIDDQIMHYMKNTGNIVLIFDNFEKLLNNNNEIKAENIKSFFEFIANINKIKIIVFTSVNIANALDLPQNSTFETRLEALTFEQMQEFLAIFRINVQPSLYNEIYNQTSGYIFTLKFLATAIQVLDVPIEEILAEAMRSEMTLNVYIAQRIINKLLPAERKLLNYFVFFRHAITSDILKAIDNTTGNTQDIIDTLDNYMLIDKDGTDNYRMRSFLKTILYGMILPVEKAKLHKQIATFYAEQIPLNPDARVLELSRTTMYSEKFYHFNIYSKLEKNIGLQNNKIDENSLRQETKLNSNNIKYIASTKYFPDFKTKNTDDEKHSKMLEDFNPFDNMTNVHKGKIPATKEEESSAEISSFNIGLDDAVETNPADLSRDDADMLFNKGLELFNNNKTAESVSYFSKAVASFENKNTAKFYQAKFYLAKAYTDNYKYEDAKNILEELLNSNIDTGLNAEVLSEIATIYEYTQEYSFALKYYEQALSLAQKNRLQNIAAKVHFKLALLYDYGNETDKALYNYMLASSNAIDVKDNVIIAASYSNIASIYEERKDYDKATAYYKQSLQEDERHENYEGQTKTLSALGNIYLAQKEYNVAVKFFIRETQTAKKTGDKYLMASSYLELGDTFFRKRDFKNAVKAYFLSKKNIDTTISTDSKNKIERRFDMLVEQIGESAYKKILNELRNA